MQLAWGNASDKHQDPVLDSSFLSTASPVTQQRHRRFLSYQDPNLALKSPFPPSPRKTQAQTVLLKNSIPSINASSASLHPKDNCFGCRLVSSISQSGFRNFILLITNISNKQIIKCFWNSFGFCNTGD